MSTLVDSKLGWRTPFKTVVIIPNWNGQNELRAAIDSILAQSVPCHLIVVDNGSIDASLTIVETEYPQVELIKHSVNKGYAGGVNPGFIRAIELGASYAAPFNNDAVADLDWLAELVNCLENRPEVGIATCKVASSDGKHLDSTGDYYTTWGLPYPRGRGEVDSLQYDSQTEVFAASGAASLYRVSMLRQIGLFDEDYFAYYEDVDLSFRAQLAGWKIAYVPGAVVYHETSTTGSKIKGFFTYQTQKNLPILLIKNVPLKLLPILIPRFALVYLFFYGAAIQRHQFGYALQGSARALYYLPRKLTQRRQIQRGSIVSEDYIKSMLVWDLPPNAARLRRLRSAWRNLTGKSIS